MGLYCSNVVMINKIFYKIYIDPKNYEDDL